MDRPLGSVFSCSRLLALAHARPETHDALETLEGRGVYPLSVRTTFTNHKPKMLNKKEAVTEILVLYGSQTGNSEAAATLIASLLPSKLSSSSITARHMQLDDFLELEQAHWTPIVIIVTSSYGVGQAPLGCYKFRELSELILSKPEGEVFDLLKGIKYALLGLGDSKYTTFFKNPTVIDNALTKAGAERIGALGKVDASGTGENAMLNVIDSWIDNLWEPLQQAVKEGKDEKFLLVSKKSTLELCANIFPEWNGKPRAVVKKKQSRQERKETLKEFGYDPDRIFWFATRIAIPALALVIALHWEEVVEIVKTKFLSAL